jgi:hypothetical protein
VEEGGATTWLPTKRTVFLRGSLYIPGVEVCHMAYSAPVAQKGVGRPSTECLDYVVGYAGR